VPAATDLTGQRFGKLLVLGRAPDLLSKSGKTAERTWLCACDCGNTDVIPSRRLPYCPSNAARKDAVTSCAQCRSQRVCKVCGKTFESAKTRATCSPECKTLNQRAVQLEHYYRQTAIDPDRNKRIKRDRKERAAQDPAYAQRLREQLTGQGRRKHERIMADADLHEKQKARARAHYARNAEEIQARRKEQLAAMTPEQYEAWAERARAATRKSSARIRSTPEGRERYREKMREYLRQQALRGLMHASDELIKRSLDDDK